jgi:hypothetical protein
VSDAARRAVLIAAVLAVLVGVGVTGSGAGSGATGGAGSATVAGAEGVKGQGGSTAPVVAPRPAGLAESGVTETGVAATDVAETGVAETGVAPTGAESSAWFCAGGTGTGGAAQATVVLTNSTARTVSGTLTAVPSGGAARSVPVSVPAHGQIGVVPSQVVAGAMVAAAVVLGGGGVGVSQVVSGALGTSAASCASATATRWYFAGGSTGSGDTLSLALFNPASTTAVVDVSLVSATTGPSTPPAFQGIDVPARSLVIEDIGDQDIDDAVVATEVATLSGSVVAAELQSSGQPADGGSSVVLGATAAASLWSFAQNTDLTGGTNVFHVLNPSSSPVEVTVRLGLEQGAAEPLYIRMPPGSVTSLIAQNQTRIPTGTPYAVTFASTGGAGIVVARHVTAPSGASAPQQGDMAGVPGGADRWLLPAVPAPGAGVWALAVVDLNAAPVSVTVGTFVHGRLTPVAGLGHRRVRFGTPLVVGPNPAPPVGTVPMVVLSSAPVALEFDTVPAGSPGVVVTPALPLGR